MPSYSYECPRCAQQITQTLTLADHDHFAPVCRACRKRMFQVICAPQIVRDIEPYQSMITGERVAGRAQHRAHLREHGCVEVGNEKPPQRKAAAPKQSRRQVLHQQLGDMNDKQVQQIAKQEIKTRHV